ncbi:hypothetical protein GBC03_12590 [Citrobacter telavivensis]|uniref:Uncharacterized protein n=1 Tax=Citrobacter telavivensis TaxID=2653932 RepID=A0A6L5E8X2_9ENTR|nr:hypothetical protein [Citrobacter telavivensis]ELM1462755.1 hypothetical protein [Salmonella enterica]MPQ51947.1 hypothetical protein [Citrobacter telavivensis]QFS70980.1 hypothetical protein GBC03_12590 [Citrobacter telavivensis]
MLIVSVLRCGKNFTSKHAQWLHRQFGGRKSLCLTDAKTIEGVETAPLLYNWPGWWSKIELFNPDHPVIGNQDLLYFDIDVVVTGNLDVFEIATDFTMLREFNHPTRVNSSIMMIPVSVKRKVWEAFIADPDKIMNECQTEEKWGDQGFIGSILHPMLWQDIIPGSVISYKCDIATNKMIGYNSVLANPNATGEVPENVSVVCFHGSPRPWRTGFNWVPSFSIKDSLYGKLKNFKLKLKNS